MNTPARRRGGRRPAQRPRHFKYVIILPAVFILLFIGIFPLVYTLVASVQNITMLEEDTSFHGLIHYRHLFEDVRLWESIGHTLLITGIALPVRAGARAS